MGATFATGPMGEAGPMGATGAAGPDNVLVGKTVQAVGAGDTGMGILYNHVSGLWEKSDMYMRNPLRPSGALYETFFRQCPSVSGAVLVSNRLAMSAIALPAGLPIASITFMTASAQNTPNLQIFGLYDNALNLLANTNNDGATAWPTNTTKTLSLTSTFTTAYSGLYYLGILVAAASHGGLVSAAVSYLAYLSLPMLSGLSNTGVSSLPNPANALSALSYAPYAFVS